MSGAPIGAGCGVCWLRASGSGWWFGESGSSSVISSATAPVRMDRRADCRADRHPGSLCRRRHRRPQRKAGPGSSATAQFDRPRSIRRSGRLAAALCGRVYCATAIQQIFSCRLSSAAKAKGTTLVNGRDILVLSLSAGVEHGQSIASVHHRGASHQECDHHRRTYRDLHTPSLASPRSMAGLWRQQGPRRHYLDRCQPC